MREGEVDGKGYYFTDRQSMEEDIRNGLYLEYGEYNGNLYGTRLDSIDAVSSAGKMCVLDVNPTVTWYIHYLNKDKWMFPISEGLIISPPPVKP